MPDETVISKLCFTDIPKKVAREFKAACALNINKVTGKPYKQREALIELMEGFVAKANDEGITL